MKKLLLLLIFTQFAFAKTLTIDTKSSTIGWHGTKIGGEHMGTVKFKSGTVELDGDKLKGASFVVDMKTIDCTDLSGEWKTKLENHLKNDDFFAVDKFPETTLKLDEVISQSGNTYDVAATLTIKGKSAPVKYKVKKDGNKFSGKLTFDRTKYGIKYKSKSFFSDLGDKVIYDDVNLKFNIVAK
jgi:polyisoprenoid-binding protein YceI